MTEDLREYLLWRLKHIREEKSKLPHMSHSDKIKRDMSQKLRGRLVELQRLLEIIHKNKNFKGYADFEKSKTIHLRKMRLFTKEHYKDYSQNNITNS